MPRCAFTKLISWDEQLCEATIMQRLCISLGASQSPKLMVVLRSCRPHLIKTVNAQNASQKPELLLLDDHTYFGLFEALGHYIIVSSSEAF